MRPWAIVRFCLALLLSCVAAIAAIALIAWIDWGVAGGPVAVLISVGTLLATVLSIVAIFYVLVFKPNPNRHRARRWGLARFCLATILGCCAGIALFAAWAGLTYETEWGVRQDLTSCLMLVALVISVVALFAALVFRPSPAGKIHRPEPAHRPTLPGQPRQ